MMVKLLVTMMLVNALFISPVQSSEWIEDWRADFGSDECYLWRSFTYDEQLSERRFDTRSTIFNFNFRWIVGDRFFQGIEDNARLEAFEAARIVSEELYFVAFAPGERRLRRSGPQVTGLSVNGNEARKLELPVDPELGGWGYFVITGKQAQTIFDQISSGSQVIFEVSRSSDGDTSFTYEEAPSESFSVRSAQFKACIEVLGQRAGD